MVLSILLPAVLPTDVADDSEFTILHCNNPNSMNAEMKVEVSSTFLNRNGGLEATWADGFQEESVGDDSIYTKVIAANDLILEEKDDDADSK